MLVEMLAMAASPDGVLHAGQVYDLPRKQAEELCKMQPHGRAYARKVERGTRDVSEVSRPADPNEVEGA